MPFRAHDDRIKYGLDPFQFGLLWNAKQLKPGKRPLVVLIHGGCWLSAYDIAHSYPMATELATQGFSVFSLEYRRTGNQGGGWPGSFDDVIAGLKQIARFSDLEQYSKITLVGHSAGGHLALLAAAHLDKWQPVGVPVSVVGLAAITDIEQYAKGQNSCQTAGVQFMGGSPQERSKEYEAANPTRFEFNLPVLLLHGKEDPIVPVAQSNAINDSQVKVIKQQGAGHFDWIHPGTPSFKVLLDELKKPLDTVITVSENESELSIEPNRQSGGRVPSPSVVF
ncbi:MAG: alpha/beta hydrolase [Gammaproteobacteria bacterium]|nr:alpha/beta hydrolase [Gammaproteobacteria bacterium]